MHSRLAILALMTAGLCFPQAKISVEQLKTWVKSSISLKHPDIKLAQSLRGVRLTEKLDDRTIEEMQGWGAGPKTVIALRALRDSSASFTVAAPPPPRLVVVEGPPPPSYEEQRKVMNAVTEYAQSYIERLPDFICTQVTRRFVDPYGKESWYPLDVITERLTFFEKKEDYKVVLVNNRPMNVGHEQLGGTTSSGEFGTMLKEIFDPETHTDFGWERWTTWRGRRTYVFSYRVAKHRSKYRILAFSSPKSHEEYVTGYRGSLYIDREDLKVMRIKMEAEGLPADFPIQEVRLTLDFDHTKIGDQEFVLPLKSELKSREGPKLLVKNDVEFRMYRKFGADASITYDTPEPLPPDKTQEQPPKP